MKAFFEAIGMVFCVLWFFGSLGVLDFHICIKDAGQCKIVPQTKTAP